MLVVWWSEETPKRRTSLERRVYRHLQSLVDGGQIMSTRLRVVRSADVGLLVSVIGLVNHAYHECHMLLLMRFAGNSTGLDDRCRSKQTELPLHR